MAFVERTGGSGSWRLYFSSSLLSFLRKLFTPASAPFPHPQVLSGAESIKPRYPYGKTLLSLLIDLLKELSKAFRELIPLGQSLDSSRNVRSNTPSSHLHEPSSSRRHKLVE
jgi:hypothetical protein